MLRHVHVVVLLLLAVARSQSARLGHYNVSTNEISVSGLSSGAFFAVQFHVAFSSTIVGMGAVAGGPFWCANDNFFIANSSCTTKPELISVSELISVTYATYYTTRTIDDPENMKNHKVYIFSGTLDTVVVPGVVKKLEEYYSHFTPKGVSTEFSIPAAHSMVTDSYGNACNYLGLPFINNCGYSTAYHVLNHIYGDIKMANASSGRSENLLEFDQTEFFIFNISMDTTGFVYVPKDCQDGHKECRLHIAFHGCMQGRKFVSNTYALHAGYNELAEENDMIILYPQVTTTSVLPIPRNPKGCWDWWGYTAPSYASKLGPQMAAVKGMLDRVAL